MRFAESAYEHGYTRADVTLALRKRMGDRINYPRNGSRTVVGPDLSGNPIVVIMNIEEDMVYHVYRYEKRYEKVLFRAFRVI